MREGLRNQTGEGITATRKLPSLGLEGHRRRWLARNAGSRTFLQGLEPHQAFVGPGRDGLSARDPRPPGRQELRAVEKMVAK